MIEIDSIDMLQATIDEGIEVFVNDFILFNGHKAIIATKPGHTFSIQIGLVKEDRVLVCFNLTADIMAHLNSFSDFIKNIPSWDRDFDGLCLTITEFGHYRISLSLNDNFESIDFSDIKLFKQGLDTLNIQVTETQASERYSIICNCIDDDVIKIDMDDNSVKSVKSGKDFGAIEKTYTARVHEPDSNQDYTCTLKTPSATLTINPAEHSFIINSLKPLT